MMNNSIKNVIDNLESLFSKFNRRYFNNELLTPVITVSPDTTSGAYGWCTSWKAWQSKSEKSEKKSTVNIADITHENLNEKKDEPGFYEINICAEYLSRPFIDICETMLHEMIHLLNLQNNVQDTSRSGKYHNKKYKEVAEQHGLICEKTEKYGFADTKLTDSTKYWIEQSCQDENCFNLYRSKMAKLNIPKKQSTRKYVCPCCGTIVRATKEVRIICADCDVELELET